MPGLFPVVLFATSLVVRQDASLRSGCEVSDETLAQAPAGSKAEVRFAMSGSTQTCYKVAVQTSGGFVTGFLPASALDGLEEFTRQIQKAPAVHTGVIRSAPMTNATAEVNLPAIHGASHYPLVKASKLLEKRQPRAALEAVEEGMRVHGRDYQFLLLAGIAAYQADETRVAVDYLRESQRVQQDHSVQRLIEQLEREQAADKSSEKL